MLSAIRKNQHSLTLLIVLLTIVSFIWLYNRTNLSQVGTNDLGTMYGKVLQRATVERETRNYRLALALGLTDFVRDMGGFVENEEAALSYFIFNVLILEHEVKALKIVPTEKEIATAIQALPLFQTHGVFDGEKYARMMKESLASRGFTERQLEEVISDSLSLKKLKEVITSPIVVSEAQVREAARVYQPLKAEAIFFNAASYLNDAKKKTLSLEEKKSFYEKNKKFFTSEDQRAVSYVVAALSPEQQKADTKERVRALGQLAEQLTTLKEKAKAELQNGKAFEKIAEANGYKAVVTADFNKQGEEIAIALSPEHQEKKQTHQLPQELVDAAFKLVNNGDLSEVIQSGSSLYLLRLTRATPSRTLSFSEVEKKVEQLLEKEQAIQEARKVATQRVQKIREALTTGKSFSQAALLVGCKAESLPFLSPEKAASSSQLSPWQKEALLATLPLQAGELSELKHTSLGDVVVYLQERTPLAEADWKEHRGAIEENFLQQEQGLLFFEWMRKARANAKITLFDGRHRRSLLQRIFEK
ncbi:MAG: SurA N-terminal domain-containing protein [Chthoniobacterales bacterium]|nr:SurA N-terminal domain-containing protein [Chthoniobacterales bacterium]